MAKGRTTPRRNTPADNGDDRFEMSPDGRCKLVVDGAVYRFRRPKFGEFRKLRELLAERDDESLRLTAKANDGEAAQADADDDDAATPTAEGKLEDALRKKAVLRDLDDAVIALNIAWVETALTMTLDADGETEMPPTDDWPPEMADAAFLRDLMTHWRHRPLALGGQGLPTSP